MTQQTTEQVTDGTEDQAVLVQSNGADRYDLLAQMVQREGYTDSVIWEGQAPTLGVGTNMEVDTNVKLVLAELGIDAPADGAVDPSLKEYNELVEAMVKKAEQVNNASDLTAYNTNVETLLSNYVQGNDDLSDASTILSITEEQAKVVFESFVYIDIVNGSKLSSTHATNSIAKINTLPDGPLKEALYAALYSMAYNGGNEGTSLVQGGFEAAITDAVDNGDLYSLFDDMVFDSIGATDAAGTMHHVRGLQERRLDEFAIILQNATPDLVTLFLEGVVDNIDDIASEINDIEAFTNTGGYRDSTEAEENQSYDRINEQIESALNRLKDQGYDVSGFSADDLRISQNNNNGVVPDALKNLIDSVNQQTNRPSSYQQWVIEGDVAMEYGPKWKSVAGGGAGYWVIEEVARYEKPTDMSKTWEAYLPGLARCLTPAFDTESHSWDYSESFDGQPTLTDETRWKVDTLRGYAQLNHYVLDTSQGWVLELDTSAPRNLAERRWEVDPNNADAAICLIQSSFDRATGEWSDFQPTDGRARYRNPTWTWDGQSDTAYQLLATEVEPTRGEWINPEHTGITMSNDTGFPLESTAIWVRNDTQPWVIEKKWAAFEVGPNGADWVVHSSLDSKPQDEIEGWRYINSGQSVTFWHYDVDSQGGWVEVEGETVDMPEQGWYQVSDTEYALHDYAPYTFDADQQTWSYGVSETSIKPDDYWVLVSGSAQKIQYTQFNGDGTWLEEPGQVVPQPDSYWLQEVEVAQQFTFKFDAAVGWKEVEGQALQKPSDYWEQQGNSAQKYSHVFSEVSGWDTFATSTRMDKPEGYWQRAGDIATNFEYQFDAAVGWKEVNVVSESKPADFWQLNGSIALLIGTEFSSDSGWVTTTLESVAKPASYWVQVGNNAVQYNYAFTSSQGWTAQAGDSVSRPSSFWRQSGNTAQEISFVVDQEEGWVESIGSETVKPESYWTQSGNTATQTVFDFSSSQGWVSRIDQTKTKPTDYWVQQGDSAQKYSHSFSSSVGWASYDTGTHSNKPTDFWVQDGNVARKKTYVFSSSTGWEQSSTSTTKTKGSDYWVQSGSGSYKYTYEFSSSVGWEAVNTGESRSQGSDYWVKDGDSAYRYSYRFTAESGWHSYKTTSSNSKESDFWVKSGSSAYKYSYQFSSSKGWYSYKTSTSNSKKSDYWVQSGSSAYKYSYKFSSSKGWYSYKTSTSNTKKSDFWVQSGSSAYKYSYTFSTSKGWYSYKTSSSNSKGSDYWVKVGNSAYKYSYKFSSSSGWTKYDTGSRNYYRSSSWSVSGSTAKKYESKFSSSKGWYRKVTSTKTKPSAYSKSYGSYIIYYDYRWSGSSWSKYQKSKACLYGGDPIVMDLNGNGAEMTELSDSNAYFDMDGDGVAEHTAWVASNDGILAFDANGDGIISEMNEIIFLEYTEGATTDLEGLASFDTNKNGKLDSGDAQWHQFGVWQDKDGDGVTDKGEFKTLSDMGIAEINLDKENVDAGHGETYEILGVSNYTMEDGTKEELIEALFTYEDDISALTSELAQFDAGSEDDVAETGRSKKTVSFGLA